MEWYELIFVLIDMRSFSNLWYWIALAAIWSSSSHWVMGIPFDMITRARRHGGQAMEDLQTMARINSSRLLHISRSSGTWIIAFTSFFLTMLIILGFFQRVEFAQAVFLLIAPMILVAFMSLRTAFGIEQRQPEGQVLVSALIRLRFVVQLIGMFAIFVTSLFGMYMNLNAGGWG